MRFFIIVSMLMSVTAKADSVKANGELLAVETDSYSPPKIHRIWQYTIAFMAPDGSQVDPGQPVLMFKTDQLQERLMDKSGELSVKQSELKQAKVSEIETLQNKKLAIEEKKMLLDKAIRKADLPKSVIALNEYEENQLKYELAKLEYQHALEDMKLTKEKLKTEEDILNAKIVKLDAEVKELNNSIQSMKIMSKRKGIVMHQTDHSKNKYAVGDSVWGGARVTQVADLENITATLEIKENDLSKVKEGQKVTFTMDAYPDLEFTGRIATLSKVVRIKSKFQPSKILDAKIAIDETDLEIMRPGMSIKANIHTGGEL